jgi:antitoxin VapB
MALNIKNPKTEKLARELAKSTGEGITTAVTRALDERLERVRVKHGASLANHLLRIATDCAAHLKGASRSADHGELLYDEKGLPR